MAKLTMPVTATATPLRLRLHSVAARAERRYAVNLVRLMEIGNLVGNTAQLSFLEPCTWTLAFSCGAEFSNFSLCRVIKEKQLLACTKDHEQWFGLKEPYDAEKEINNLVSNGIVIEASYGLSASDIVFTMSNGIIIEILSTSTGYETWEYRSAEGVLYVATGYGKINEF